MSTGSGRERVLVIGDDMRIFLAVVRSLGRAGKEVHAAPFNWHSPALKSKFIHKVHRLPRFSEDPVAWREQISELMRGHSFDLVVPCCDRAILPLHLHREDFAGLPIAIPGPEAMELLFDKERTRQLCADLDIPVAPGTRLSASDTAADLVRRFGIPLVIKPRKSYWLDRLDTAGKVWIVESEAELKELLPTIHDPSRYLVEGYFDGAGVGVSVLADEGKVMHAFQHRRLRQGKGGCSSYRVSEPVNQELLAACEKIAGGTNLSGVCMFEFRYNLSDGSWILLETNARFWGSMGLPLSIGVDFPRYLYDAMVDRRHHEPVRYPAGIRSRNLVLDGLNLVSEARHLRRGEIAAWTASVGDFLAQPVRWATGRERSDSFVGDDLRPAMWECATLGKGILQKLTRHGRPGLGRRLLAGRRADAPSSSPAG